MKKLKEKKEPRYAMIAVSKETRERLTARKRYSRDTYNDVIGILLKATEARDYPL